MVSDPMCVIRNLLAKLGCLASRIIKCTRCGDNSSYRNSVDGCSIKPSKLFTLCGQLRVSGCDEGISSWGFESNRILVEKKVVRHYMREICMFIRSRTTDFNFRFCWVTCSRTTLYEGFEVLVSCLRCLSAAVSCSATRAC